MAVIDLAGQLDPAREYGVPDLYDITDVGMREAVSMWLYDDEGRFGFPRLAFEATGPNWESDLIQVSVAFPSGRLLDASGSAPARPREDDDGNLSIFAAGELEFRVVEPFKQWRVSFNGPAVDTTSEAQRDRTVDSSVTTDIALEIDVTIAAPPWITGKKPDVTPGDGVPNFFDRAGLRYEQLVRAAGTLRIGDEEWSFTASGIRVRRYGVRNITGLGGLSWQSAIFPSGRGFRYQVLLPDLYEEAFILDTGRLLPARTVDVSWMTKLIPSGEDVSFVLESELGRHEIQAETVYSFFIPYGDEVPTEGAWPLHWQHAGVRYTWDGEVTYGMIERVSALDKVEL
jgi:hypothetical protein